MKLNVGTIRSNCEGFDDIAYLAEQTKSSFLDVVELDLSSCNFFEANMVAPLYAVVSRLRDHLNDVSITNMHYKVEEIFKKNGFLAVFNQPTMIDTNQTTMPFKIFKLNAGAQFNDYLHTYMRGRGIPRMTDALIKRFLQSLFEIFLNAAIHSESASGIFVCGQFFPKKHRMDFTIADAGIGIRENVRRYTKNMRLSSSAAIKWAMTEGNTTKRGSQPGGLGLKLIRDFIQMNQGKLQIVSRFGYYEFSTNGVVLIKMKHDFPGTCINIEINTQDTRSYRLKSELTSEDIF